MDRKIYTIMLLMFLVGLVGVGNLVSAQIDEERYSLENMKLIGSHTEDSTSYIGTSYLNYQINVSVKKGWNLLSGISILDIKSDSDIKKNEIYNFIYNRGYNRYLRLESQESFVNYVENLDISQKFYPHFVGQSTWVYSKRNGILVYDAIMFPLNPTLANGWNFVSITPGMIGKTLDEIKGNCNIEKLYWWTDKENPEGSWGDLLQITSSGKRAIDVLLSDNFSAGHGIIVKVSSECSLETSKDNPQISPPSLPELPSSSSHQSTSHDIEFPEHVGLFTLTSSGEDPSCNKNPVTFCVKDAWYSSSDERFNEVYVSNFVFNKDAKDIKTMKSTIQIVGVEVIDNVYINTTAILDEAVGSLAWFSEDGDYVSIWTFLLNSPSRTIGTSEDAREFLETPLLDYFLNKYPPIKIK